MKRLVRAGTVQANRVDELLAIVDDAFEIEACSGILGATGSGKAIRLTSIPGVTRDKENDFRDDGTSFQGYLYKGVVPISYARHGDDVYITVAFHHLSTMSYDEYKNFPSYKDGDTYNGVPSASFDSDNFQAILEAAYNDIQDFASNVTDADDGEISDRVRLINEGCAAYKKKVEDYIQSKSTQILNLSEYQFKELKRYVGDAGKRTADYILEASQSSKRDFLRRDLDGLISQISNSWNFKYIAKMFGDNVEE